VWFSVLPLAVSVFSAALPGLDTQNRGGCRGVFFARGGLAVDAIDRAETQILVNAYGFTTSSSAVEALTGQSSAASR
jgi:hypothetical protein